MPGAPAYIVTFSDMVTLLLTFFVMLLSMADMQDPELLNSSRDSFINHINTYGLGMLSGKPMSPQLDQSQVKYNVDEADPDTNVRTLDAEEERIRRLYNKVAQKTRTMPSQITCKKMDFDVTRIRFANRQATLNKSARNFLDRFASDLQQQTRSGDTMLYVLGLADDAKAGKDQWILSSLRAQRVADYLGDSFHSEFRCPVYAWGGGPGGQWIDEDSPAEKGSQILIAILRQDTY